MARLGVLIESRGKLVPSEVKLSATPRPAMAAGIETLRSDLGPAAATGYVVHPGGIQLPLGKHAVALPFAGL